MIGVWVSVDNFEKWGSWVRRKEKGYFRVLVQVSFSIYLDFVGLGFRVDEIF